jgi:eukaryotic-like serine/threonine-protein kinase
VASGQHFLGPFQLVRMIRSGQTCQVWEALRSGTEERVALKVLLQEHLKKKEQVEALRHEAEVGKTLEHPRVIKIHGFYQQHSLPFIAMELFTANNLKQEVREHLDRLLLDIDSVLVACCEGVAHLHKKGWLHCDMKPDNFLINNSREVKLIDFSIAQKLQKSIFGGWGGGNRAVSGTRSYMAPEQIRNSSLSIATDVYGLGCTFFEMVSGKLPFTAGTPNELLSKHLSASIPSVLPANNLVSDAFADILMKMMAKKPADRYSSVETVLGEIKKIRVLKPGSQKKVQSRIDGTA